ncbi:hypothetical protein Pan181_02170 [Aeoliella mucimassa]|uniref:Uncharacterized protein n=1 Tax=Aeoliella mucimassa TaxID=2527972 RepID=A0A518AH42_9BACT|nr:hypothetical protein Pan181_02170 [Aeoliella mucimassa]
MYTLFSSVFLSGFTLEFQAFIVDLAVHDPLALFGFHETESRCPSGAAQPLAGKGVPATKL